MGTWRITLGSKCLSPGLGGKACSRSWLLLMQGGWPVQILAQG